MKIATYNVNSIRSRMHIVLPWLQANRPDFLCMQETKVADDIFPAAEFEKLGYHAVFRGEKQYKGVAIVSKIKPQDVVHGFDSEPADADRMIIARYSDLTIINTYVPQGQEMDSPQFAYKLEWFARFRRYLKKNFQPGQNIIWCGDFNVAPEDMDVHDPKRLLGHVCFNPEIWKAYEEARAFGFTDVLRLHHPGVAGLYTFYDYRVKDSVKRKLGWRVDHILATKSLAAKSKSCTIDLESRLAEKPSDHVIVSAQW
ncbi:MAG: exodeoxyribonuclease III [Smithella sp.]|nr:exodeoxyribonuclease III [Smithella sp.]